MGAEGLGPLQRGALVAISTNQALFSLLGTYYGGDGIRTFGLPDLRGRAILGSTGQSGNYPAGLDIRAGHGDAYNPADSPASSRHRRFQYAVHQPSPGDARRAISSPPTPTPPRDIFLLAGSDETNLALGTNIVPDGGNQPHNNMQPYLTVNYVIAMQGIYPSRN